MTTYAIEIDGLKGRHTVQLRSAADRDAYLRALQQSSEVRYVENVRVSVKKGTRWELQAEYVRSPKTGNLYFSSHAPR